MSLVHDEDSFVKNFKLSHAPISHFFHVNRYLVAMHGLTSDGIVLLDLVLNLSNDVTYIINFDALNGSRRSTLLQV